MCIVESARLTLTFSSNFPVTNNRRSWTILILSFNLPNKRFENRLNFCEQYNPAILISGGIDSSLYASYLNEFEGDRLHGVNCNFGDEDPEFEFARIARGKN